ncbi:hydrolase [Companilactobacillus mishanensis]|uniref:hydrolase n=1 Tax=Companilactobacillus mishanensis TaxID=2486008 RepID=UPI001930EE38|nr:hydrolase [Companilactobacillus mishanensis]
MIKQFKLEALFFSGLMLVSFMGYSANVYADTDNNDTKIENVNLGNTLNVENLKNTKATKNKLNKKISLPGNKEVIPGIRGSEKDNDFKAVQEPKEEPVVEAAPVAQPEPVAQPVQQQVATPQVQAAAQPATQSMGTFKVSFYDPASLGSGMGYDGVAANLSVLPRGTRIKITTAQGDVWYKTVNDTGTFASANPQQIDVAMPNSMVPSYGITSATVEIIG